MKRTIAKRKRYIDNTSILIENIKPMKMNIEKIKNITILEDELKQYTINTIPNKLLKEVKKLGFSDTQIAYLLNTTAKKVKNLRQNIAVSPIYKMVDRIFFYWCKERIFFHLEMEPCCKNLEFDIFCFVQDVFISLHHSTTVIIHTRVYY